MQPYCFEIIKIMLTSVICLSLSYAIGLSLFLLVLNENINLLTRTLNPVLFIFIGFILIILIMFICANCFRCFDKKLKKYFNHLLILFMCLYFY